MKLSKNMRNCMGRAAAAVLCAAMVLPMLPAIPAYAAGQPEIHVHTQECFQQSRGALKCGKAHAHTDSCYEIAYGDVICGLEGLPADLVPMAGSATDADNSLDWRASLDGETDPVKRAAIAAAGMPGEASSSDIETVNSVLDAAGIPGSQLARYDTVEAWDKAYKHTQLNRNDNGKTGLPKAGDIVFFNDNKDGTQAATRMGVVASVNAQDKSVTVTVSNGSSAETVHIGTAQACWYLDMAAACLGMTGVSDNSQNGDQNNGEAGTQEPGQDGTPGNGDDNNNDDNQGQDNGGNSDNEFRCKLGLVEHVHDKSCYENTAGGEAGALTCGKQEHVHTADCLEGTEVRTDGDKVIYKDGKIYKVTYDEDGNEVLEEIADADVRSNGDVYDADGNFVGNLFDTDGDGVLSKEELEAASEIFDKLIDKIEESAPAAKVAAKMMRMAMANGLSNAFHQPRRIGDNDNYTFEGYGSTSVGLRGRGFDTTYKQVDTSELISINLYDYTGIEVQPDVKQSGGEREPIYPKTGNIAYLPWFVSDPGPSMDRINSPDMFSGFNFGDYLLFAENGNRGAYIRTPSLNQIAKFGWASIPGLTSWTDNVPLGIFGTFTSNVLVRSVDTDDFGPGVSDDGINDRGSIMYLFPKNAEKGYTGNGVVKINDGNVSGLLSKDLRRANHYVFDSTVTHAQWSEKKDSFDLYDAVITPNMVPYSYGNFLPFNDILNEATCVADIDANYINYHDGRYDADKKSVRERIRMKANDGTYAGRKPYTGDIYTEGGMWRCPFLNGATSISDILSRLDAADAKYFRNDCRMPSYMRYNNTYGNGILALLNRGIWDAMWSDYTWRDASPYERMKAANEATQAHKKGKVVNPKIETSSDRLYNIDYDVPKNFHFGMDMSFSFMQSVNEPLEFAFTGDDDVFVYIDGIRFLDLGGVHNAVSGEIDFEHGLVRYYTTYGSGVWIPIGNNTGVASNSALDAVNVKNRLSSELAMPNNRVPLAVFTFDTVLDRAGFVKDPEETVLPPYTIGNVSFPSPGTIVTFTNHYNGQTVSMLRIELAGDVTSYRFLDYSKHDLNFYFMERGAGSSLCQIDFTLPLVQNNELKIEKAVEASNGNPESTETLLGNPDFSFQVFSCDYDKSNSSLLLSPGDEYDVLNGDGSLAYTGTVDADGIISIKKGQSIRILRPENTGYYFVRELLDERLFEEYGVIVNNSYAAMNINGVPFEIGGTKYYERDSYVMNFQAFEGYVKFVNRLTRQAGIVEIQKTTNLGDDEGSYDFEVRLDGEALPVGTEYELLPIQVDTNFGTKGETKTVETEGIVTVPNGQKAVIRHVLYGTKVEIKETTASQEGFRPMYELYVDGEKKSDGTADNGYVTWTLLRNPEAMAEGIDGMHVVLKCRNVKDGDLPNAGGAGTTAFLLIGLTAMGAAALGLAMMKKKRR